MILDLSTRLPQMQLAVVVIELTFRAERKVYLQNGHEKGSTQVTVTD